MNAIDWTVIETAEARFNATQLHHKETVFTLSNGYLGTRGSFEEGYPNANPATLINGVYDDAMLVSTELVNCPDWLSLTITVAGERFRLNQGTVLKYQRWLDLRQGLLSRRVRWRSPAGHTLDLWFERFVSLADHHILALRCRIKPLNFNAPMEVHASLNSYADNEGTRHWEWVNQGEASDRIWLQVRTRSSAIELGMAARLTVTGADEVHTSSIGVQGCPTLIAKFEGRSHQTVMLEKIVTVYTSRDLDLPLTQQSSELSDTDTECIALSPAEAAVAKLNELSQYATLFAAHISTWAALWKDSDVQIEGDTSAQLAIRFNLFQLLSAAPRQDDRVSIPAKTLSGFAYRGHVFWDTEIFILPLLIFTQPALARNLLTYRYHTLPGARRKAQAAGYEGAMYVWESADTGDEVTPTWVPSCTSNELIRIWCGDIEVHISSDVAYAAYQYWQATGDDDWMQACGAEMILDTAVFWGSRVTWNAAKNRYEILDVIGPDEYHERIDNNAFTNRLTQWHLKTALGILGWLRRHYPQRAAELERSLDLSRDRLHQWYNIIRKIWIPIDPNTGLVEQFEGFFQLEDVDLQSYEPRGRSMQVILGIEGANQRQVLKQADVLMLQYVLRQEMFIRPLNKGNRAADLLRQRQSLQTNWDYYEPRTDHTYGSSLGPPVHAILACELGKVEEAYSHFMRSALVDLSDVRGNAAEGIHAASAGGVWQATVFGFGGISLTPNGPVATPALPPQWKRLKFALQWRGERYEFDLHSEPNMLHSQPETTAVPTHAPVGEATVPNAFPFFQSAPLKGVIFDLDGVLTDTSEFHYQGWKRLADEIGVPFDRHANEALRGVSRRDSLLHLLQGKPVSDAEFQEMMDRKNQYYLALIETISPKDLLPGAGTLLRELRDAGIRVAIGSSSKNARQVVELLGIADWVDAIADGHSVTRSKPAPDVFLHAAEQLGLDPATCVVVEDAASGVEAALKAGMRVVGLGPRSRVGAAHLVFSSLEHVHWTDLSNELSRWVPKPTVYSLVTS